MELFRGTAPKVKFDLPTPNTSVVDVTLFVDGVDKGAKQFTMVDGAAEVQLPYLQYDGEIALNWKFIIEYETYTERVYYDVVTPILSKQEIKDIFDPEPLTDSHYIKIEAATRHIINAHCGQTFGKYIGTWSVVGDDTKSLALPARLLELQNVNGQTTDYYSVVADGFNLRHYPTGIPDIKAEANGVYMDNSGVIHNPYNVNLEQFKNSRVFNIYGVWGYNNVPQSVKEAAKLLVNDYSCEDAAYRDRYLTSMTAADWRIQFNDGAFINTGNVRADQLLEPYVLRRGWAVL